MKTHTSLLPITSINIFAAEAQRALSNVCHLLCVLCASVVKKINVPLHRKNLLHGCSAVHYAASLLLILVSLCTAPAAYAALEMTSTNNIVVGAIYNNFVNTNNYHFINSGETTIKVVRLMPTCTCISATNDVDLLKPGEKLTVSILFDAKTVNGEFSRGLWLLTDDLENRQTLLRVSGEVIPLFKGFTEERINLLAKDKSNTLTNQFTFTATTTNYFLGPPHCEDLKECISFDWQQKTINTTNVWHLTTFIKPTGNMSKRANIHFPVTGPTEISDRLVRVKLTVGVELRASPSKLVTTTLVQPFIKKLYVTTHVSDSKVELLTWQPQIDGLKIEELQQKPHNRVVSTKSVKKVLPSSSRTRFECTISITPTALQELMLMDEPGITLSYPDHQPVTIPLILYEAP